jgi:metal-responsive CopG/Arc/MetJ family transcriptional regulator
VKQAASETYAARVARGRVPISLSLPAEVVEKLDAFAAKKGMTRSAAVAYLVERASK